MQSCAYLSYFQIVVYYLSLVIFTSLHRFTVHGMDTYIFPLHRSDIFSISLRFKLSTLTYHQTVQKLSYTSPLSAFLCPHISTFFRLLPYPLTFWLDDVHSPNANIHARMYLHLGSLFSQKSSKAFNILFLATSFLTIR